MTKQQSCKCDTLKNGDVINVDDSGLCVVCGRGVKRTKPTEEFEQILDEICGTGTWLVSGAERKKYAKRFSESLTTYGNARYEEGVKAERERCKNLVVAHLRTNTYDGNDARVFKTTIEEVVGLLKVK